ncbi:MAG: DMT family transporter [Candidatus Acidiferrales bacterium]
MQIGTPSGPAPSRRLVSVLIGVVVLVWALNFAAAKVGLRHLPALAMASFRIVFAGAIMVPIYLALRRLPIFAEAARASRVGFTAQDFWTFLYLGFFGVAISQSCFTIGLRYTSISHSAVIVGMGPIYTLVLAVLARVEKATWRKATGMAIAFAGIALLASESSMSVHSASLLGDAITMAGSVGFAFYAVLGKRVADRYDTLTMTAFNHFAGALVMLPVAVHEARAIGPAANWRAIPWESWASTMYMAIFGGALALILYFWLLRYLEASQLSAFTYLLPVSATILGIFWLGERTSWEQLFGGSLALAGVYWVESGRSADAS